MVTVSIDGLIVHKLVATNRIYNNESFDYYKTKSLLTQQITLVHFSQERENNLFGLMGQNNTSNNKKKKYI